MTRIAADESAHRAEDRRIIEDLNQQYLRAGEDGGVAWYEQNLADDFLCSTGDGAISDRAAFLKRIAGGGGGNHYEAEDVRVRFVGELALVHAGFRCLKPNGKPGTGRYTDIYTQRGGRWLCVSAHFNSF